MGSVKACYVADSIGHHELIECRQIILLWDERKVDEDPGHFEITKSLSTEAVIDTDLVVAGGGKPREDAGQPSHSPPSSSDWYRG